MKKERKNWIKMRITSPRFTISLNGTLVGCFKGGKGLRQGDPLSPYLFVLSMEVFSRLMEEYTIKGSGFKFHYRCSRMNLTHLCFADDLLLFSDANLSSISIIKATLREFELLPGLKANPSKSSLFYSGVSERMKISLLSEQQMGEGHLSVRYLGVPLISSKLSAVDCKVLLDKIAGRIDSWSSRKLSFLLFFTAFKYIGLAFLSFLREFLRILIRNSVGFYGMEIMAMLLRLKYLGLISVFLRKGVWG
jgi:hypothetical protein